MALADDLTEAAIVQREGILFAVGVADGAVWCERSDDHGLTKATWNDGSTRRKVCDLSTLGSRVSVETYNTCELQVACRSTDTVVIHASRDGGETWAAVASL